MFTEKMNRLTSDFAARILVALRGAALDELATREKAQRATRGAKRVAAKKPAAPKKAAPPKKNAAAPPVRPERDEVAAALGFFAERGRKGATADQLGAHLAELGMASKADVIGALSAQGAIRDAGFRRSTGTGHKTSAVYVSAS